MSTTRKYPMPETEPFPGQRFNEAWKGFLEGVEDTSGRVAETLDPNTATVADVVNVLKAAKLMKDS